jgi:hypothetical protein
MKSKGNNATTRKTAETENNPGKPPKRTGQETPPLPFQCARDTRHCRSDRKINRLTSCRRHTDLDIITAQINCRPRPATEQMEQGVATAINPPLSLPSPAKTKASPPPVSQQLKELAEAKSKAKMFKISIFITRTPNVGR